MANIALQQLHSVETETGLPQNLWTVLRLVEDFEIGEKASHLRLGKVEAKALYLEKYLNYP